ncbi:WAP four-disulfide core domain protein 3 isoform X2 [Syngnathus typhle]|uniref:WAP four-disulfide core domain protein 3 isoform X2 n=1 Tax=Syngnathus typhle TaxID=161592 RepID=UPI002A6A279E|nr:WAP four-disulfide core domain protein 3 isoform X2 [Syngnathus typhle]
MKQAQGPRILFQGYPSLQVVFVPTGGAHHILVCATMDKYRVCALVLALGAFLQFNTADTQDSPSNLTAILPKPGQCPRLLKVVPSHKGCACDDDCPEDHKCCVFDCGTVCVPPSFKKPGVCPRRNWGSGMCAEFCSDDSDCPNEEKCCHNGCGHECVAPYKEYCYHDGQCPGVQKCCRTTCGHACSEPC